MPISQKIRGLVDNAWVDGYPCLLATAGPDGPNISPKGSMLVYDDDHLAYWERSKKQALANLGSDRRVCVMYPNFKAQRDGVLEIRLLALLRHRRAARERPIARGYLQAAQQARAGARRRRQGHRRVDQDFARRRCEGKAAAVGGRLGALNRSNCTSGCFGPAAHAGRSALCSKHTSRMTHLHEAAIASLFDLQVQLRTTAA